MRQPDPSRNSRMRACSSWRRAVTASMRACGYSHGERRAPPLLPVALDDALDLEHLQHVGEPAPPQVHVALDLGELHPVAALRDQRDDLLGVLAGRERGADEPVLDLAVLAPGEGDPERLVDRAPGAADLLVVRDRRARNLEVHDEREVRLVVAHAERRGGDDALELVVLQRALDLDLGFGGLVAEVRARVDAVAAQPVGDAARVFDRERVDDAGAGELRHGLGEPRETLGRAREIARRRGRGSRGRAGRGARQRSSPSWSTMSSTTRSFAVAVVHSTGTPAGSRSRTPVMRR